MAPAFQRRAARWLVAAALLAAPAAAGAQLPAVATEAPLDSRQGVSFHALVRPETVYVGQQANYQVGVFLGDDVRARLRRNPEFVPPEMSGMLAYELPVTHGVVPGGGRGRLEVHVFERAVFPLLAGVHEVPPARLSYSLPLTRQFFSREESHVLRSEPTRVVAIAPPSEGRPSDFVDGAVASGLRVDALVRDESAARVGDPLLLTVRVSGRGNVNLFPRPRLDLPWAQAVAADERVTLDSTSRVVTGTKEFDWLVTPRAAGRAVLPRIRYPYFDPYGERYLLAVTEPDTLAIAAGEIAVLDSTGGSAQSSAMPLRQRWRGERPRPPSHSPLYWLAAVAFPLPALAFGLRRRGPRRRPLPAPAALLAAVVAPRAPGPPPAPAREVRAAWLRALAARVGGRSLPVGVPGALARALRREGVSAPVAGEAESLLAALDAAAYAGADASADAPPADGDLARRAAASYAAVDGEARRGRGAGGGPGRTLLLALGAALSLASASHAVQLAEATSPATLFAQGVRSYDARRFGDATELFAAASRRAPRAADAWANLGTAAWAAGDTARAAEGWQRALRLEPTADDVRSRLGLLPSEQLAGWAAVPPVAPALLDWLALAAWLAAWALAVDRARRRFRTPSAATVVFGGVAATLAVCAVLLDERLDARDLAVVRGSTPLRNTPALAAAPAAGARIGAIARVQARNGAWTLVETLDGTGWISSVQLRPLRME